MATNPSINNITHTNHDGNRLNSTGNTPPQGYNQFDNTHSSISLFGDTTYNPFFVHHVVGGSRETITPKSRLIMPTMIAPKVQPFLLHRTFYQIPYSAIQPNTWSKYKVYPLKGDDIPDNASMMLPFMHLCQAYVNIFTNTEEAQGNLSLRYCATIVRAFLQFLELIEPTSLGRTLQCTPCIKSFGKDYEENNLKSFANDYLSELYDSVFNGLMPFYYEFSPNSDNNIKVRVSSVSDAKLYLQRLMNENVGSILGRPAVDGTERDFLSAIIDYIKLYTYPKFVTQYMQQDYDKALDNLVSNYVINIRSLIGYQLAMVQYNSVGYIDDVFDTQTWHENTLGLYLDISGSSSPKGFVFNGTYVLYDNYSYKLNCDVIDALKGFDASAQSTKESLDKLNLIISYWHNLFGFAPVIRYLDYFLGGRLEPLAVGDVTIGNNPDTTVIDLSKKMSLARMLNSVNRVSRNLYDYLRGIFGYQPFNKCPYPYKVAEYVDEFEGNTISSTGSDSAKQGLGSRVLNTDFTSENKQIDFYVDDDSVILGIMHIDSIPTYDAAMLRSSFYQNRFDEFQPYMQTIGDQSTHLAELHFDWFSPYRDKVFNWQYRNAEYKQRYSYLVGDFFGSTAGYALPSPVLDVVELDSNVIRVNANEYDSFFVNSYPFVTLGWRVLYSCHCDVYTASPMLAKPKLL